MPTSISPWSYAAVAGSIDGKYATSAPRRRSAAIGGSSIRSRCARRLRAAIPKRVDPSRLVCLDLFELFEHVAEAAHRADLDAGRLELGTQARDVNLDRIGREVVAPTRDRLDDRLLGNDLLHLAEQHFEHGPFARGELERLVLQERAARHRVERERSVL